MGDFLSHYVPDHPGEIVDLEGKVLGQNTVAFTSTHWDSARGHGVASPREGMAMWWWGKTPEKNQLIVGWDQAIHLGYISSDAPSAR